MIPRQVPNDPHRAEVILLPEIKDFLLNLDWRSVGMSFRNWGPIYQACFTVFSIGISPSIKAGSANSKISAGFCHVAELISMSKNSKLALNLALIFVHEHLLYPRIGRLMEMSRE